MSDLPQVKAKVKREYFDPEQLSLMASHVQIPSKERPDSEEAQALEEGGNVLVPFDPLLSTQSYVLAEIARGKRAGANTFYILKPRQSGVTTLGIATALFWAFKFSGMIFCFIADTATRLALNRKLARGFVRSLGGVPQWRQEVDEDNRIQLSFRNESAIYWLNANSDDEGGLGRSIGATALWGTEIGLWRDVEGTLSLMSSISENNPLGLHVFEGTARGPGLFKDLYDIAARQGNTSQRAIFVPWWIHTWYELDLRRPTHRQRYKVYWEELPRLSREEARWVEGIKVRYDYDIRPTQIGWWRWHLFERKKKNLLLMYQEYPPLEEDAWVYGGNSFVDGRKLSLAMSQARARPRDGRRYFVFQSGDNVRFEDSDMSEVDPEKSYFDLVCFSPPLVGPNIRYAIGHDPSHGANEMGDHCCTQVLLCHSDKAVQVAEFVKREISTREQAWVILHLAGIYNSEGTETKLNIEQQGGGDQVLDEIARIQREVAYGYSPKLARYFSHLSHYIYYRSDSMSQRSTTLHWETSWKTKPKMLHNLKNLIEASQLELRSTELIEEIESLSLLRSGEFESAPENHRLMAMAVAGMAYQQVRDFDIAGQLGFSSSDLVAAPEGTLPASLTPDQLLAVAYDRWRGQVKEDMLAQEMEGVASEPDFLVQEDVYDEDFFL